MKELKLKIPEGQRAGQAIVNFLEKTGMVCPSCFMQFHRGISYRKNDPYELDTEELEKLWNETFKL